MDFEVYFDSLRFDRQQGDLLVDAPEVPRIIGVISASSLEIGNWRKFIEREREKSLVSIVGDLLSVLLRPGLSFVVPYSYAVVCISLNEDV